MKILLIDAFDSFSYVIYQYLLMLGADVEVVRSGTLAPREIAEHPSDVVVLGPGPGHPRDSGHVEIVQGLAGVKPVLGICLGHQAIGVAFGGLVEPARRVRHGRTSVVEHDGAGVFSGVAGLVTVTRYHSLVVSEESLRGGDLIVTARSTDDGHVMGIRHRLFPVEGVQFHPESVLTEQGLVMFRGFLDGVAR